MRVRFLGTDSQNGGSPTLFETDRGTLVVRGYTIGDSQALHDLGEAPPGEADIEIPSGLLRFFEDPMIDDQRYIAARRDDTEEAG